MQNTTCTAVLCNQVQYNTQTWMRVLRIIKISAIISFIFSLQLSARTSTQEKITIKERGASLSKILKEIQKQTGLSFFLSEETIKDSKPVDIDVKNASLKQVLDICFKNQPFTYSLNQNSIAIIPKKKEDQITEPITAQATPVDIKGRVLNKEGTGIEGATIQVRGTNKSTISNSKGQFYIKDINDGSVLIISYVGFETETIKIKGQNLITVFLSQKVVGMDEVQVIAYGQTTKKLNTGNVVSIKSADIEKQPVNNALLALEGRVPGLFITQSTGFSGTGVKVRVQGVNSIGSGNDPLYVVDGVPYTSQLLPSINRVIGMSGGPVIRSGGENYGSYGNPLSYINPSDIESIEVLKDADATAIYGSRAANGAILITTKKGKSGEQRVEINIQHGLGNVARKLNLLDRRQFLDMRYEALKNDGIQLSSLNQSSNYDLTVWDTTRYTDWQKELIGNTSNYTDLKTSISGGNTNTFYLIGSGYHRETSTLPANFNNQKASMHVQVNSTSSNQKFRVEVKNNFMVDVNQLPLIDLTDVAMQLSPVAPALYDSDGNINWETNAAGNSTWDWPGNPVAQLLNRYKNRTSNVIANVLADYELIKGLHIRSSFGYNNLQSKETATFPLLSTAPELRQNNARGGVYGNSSTSSWIIEPQVNLKSKFIGGTIDALVGSTIQQNNSEAQRFYGSGYMTDKSIEDIHSASVVVVDPSIQFKYKYNALFSRLNYNWSNRYILNLNIRRDGSSRFGYQNQFQNFWSLGGAWIFSQETWIAKKLNILSFGKLSASYGTTGNDQIGEYQFLTLYNPVTAGRPYQGINTLQPNNLPNQYLQWEETRKLHFGFYLGLLKDRVVINANYYRNRSSNQLLGYQLPISTGFNSITKNFPATVLNTGLEISVDIVNFDYKYFKWSTNLNFTVPRNKLLSFDKLEESSYANFLFVGKPITVEKKFHLIGVDPSTGAYYFSSKTNAYNPNFLEDANVLVDQSPRFYGGLENRISYKGFQFDFLFQIVKQKGPNYFFGRFPGATRLNQPTYTLDRWQKPGDIASHQRYNSNFSLRDQHINAAVYSDGVYSDASYVRLKNVSLSWQLSERMQKFMRLHRLRVFIQGQNVLTFTKYKGLDPETLSSNSLPPLRVITIGIQIML